MTQQERIDRYIEAVCAAAPPLSAEQVRRLRAVMAPSIVWRSTDAQGRRAA